MDTRTFRFISVSNKLSGAELYALHLLRCLKDMGASVALAAPEGSPIYARALASGLHVDDIAIGPKLSRSTVGYIGRTFWVQRKTLRSYVQNNPDSVFISHFKLEQILLATVPEARREYVFIEHGPIPHLLIKFPPARRLYQRGAANALSVFAASAPATDALSTLGIESAPLLAGVDAQRIAEAVAQSRVHRERIDKYFPGRTVLVYAGRLSANKGILEVTKFVANDADFAIIIMGAGELESEIVKIAESTDNVRYVGSVEDPLPIVAGSDYGVLMTSDPGEGRPLFGLECISLGVPLVGSSGSRAIQGLAEEFGPEWVRLIPDLEGLRSATTSSPQGSPPPPPSWQSSAKKFLRDVSTI